MPESEAARVKRLAKCQRLAAERRARLKAAGLCPRCGMANVSRYVHCLLCRRKVAKRVRQTWLRKRAQTA